MPGEKSLGFLAVMDGEREREENRTDDAGKRENERKREQILNASSERARKTGGRSISVDVLYWGSYTWQGPSRRIR